MFRIVTRVCRPGPVAAGRGPRSSGPRPRDFRAMAAVIELRAELLGVTPAIWRALRVPSTLSLADLHRAMQIVMAWDDYHLHVFEIAQREYGPRPEEQEEDEEEEAPPETAW